MKANKNKYFNIRTGRIEWSDTSNVNYEINVIKDKVPPIPSTTYFPLTNTSVNPVYGNTGNTGQSINGQSYIFIPNDGLYFDSPPTNFTTLFYNNNSINDPDISGWNVSNITNMGTMFYRATNFNQPLNWNVSNVTNMNSMFSRATNFNQPLGNWDVSNVTNMNNMFSYAYYFNQPLSLWNVSNVTDMISMFYSASNFNQNISGWCVSNIPSPPNNFKYGSALTVPNEPKWGTCP